MKLARLRMRSIRLGIRQRLYLAVGAIASFALISAAAGWFALTRLDHAMATVTDEGVTAMTAALNLSKQVSDLAGVAPDIVSAQSEKELQALDSGVKGKESRIEATLGVVATIMSGPHVDDIQKQTKALLTSVGQLRQVVDARIRTSQFRIDETQKLSAAHAAFLKVAEPLVEDAVFDLTTNMTSATEAGDLIKIEQNLSKLANTELLALQ
jgi:phosphoglycerate-specific signal transduction histidine kinase